MEKVKCTHCDYDGGDLSIGQEPISNKMMCSKCKRYFYPFARLSENEDK